LPVTSCRGQDGRAEGTTHIHLEVAQQARYIPGDRIGRKNRSLQKIGGRVASNNEEAIVCKRAGICNVDHVDQSGIDTGREFLGLATILMKSFPLQLAVCLLDQHGCR